MSDFDFESKIIDIPDYPEPGVIFKDITPLFDDAEALRAVVDAIADHFADKGVTKVVGAEARGFLVGVPVAYRLGCGFVPARKPGKLPRAVYSQSYSLEYGTDELQIHRDALSADDTVLIVDDLIATGGTIASRHTAEGLAPRITPEELLSYVPDVASFCSIDTVQPINLDSTNIRPEHWLLLANLIEEHYSRYDGFVICHGTDTLAYTASALSYLIQRTSKPIVLTGAQRSIDEDTTDAKVNLLDALFNCAIAVVVTLSLTWVGLLVITMRVSAGYLP